VTSFFAPGKLILLGEHGVVYGHPALAAAISRGVRAFAEPSSAPQLELPAGLNPGQQEALERAFAAASKLTRNPKVSVCVESDLPVSMGLGSSGALAVAVARALLDAAGKPDSGRVVEKIALAMEREFHGTPSGVDHTTSARGAMVLFQKGKVTTIKARRPVKVLVALVGERASTKSTVGALRERQAKWPRRYARVFKEIGQLAREGADAVRKGDLDSLGDLMNLNQGLLSALQLSSDRIDAMTRYLRAHGALGAKLTGAGGDGGAVIGLFREPDPMIKRLTDDGIECFCSQLAGPIAL
jgi:mevalonate kinase